MSPKAGIGQEEITVDQLCSDNEIIRALGEAVNAVAGAKPNNPVQFVVNCLLAPGAVVAHEGPVPALDEATKALLESALGEAVNALLSERSSRDPVQFIGLQMLASQHLNLIRRGRGEFAFWVDARDAVTASLQDQWAKYRRCLLTQTGYVGDPNRLLLKGIHIDDVRTWPERLADTDEVVDWVAHLVSKKEYTVTPVAVSDLRQAIFETRRTQCIRASSDSFKLSDGKMSDAVPIQLAQAQQRRWDRCQGAEIETLLLSGAVALLDAHWLVAFWERGGRSLAKRQDLPSEAFIALRELKAAGCPLEGLPCILQSYMWLQPDTPDPFGYTLGQMIFMLKAFTAMRPDQLGNIYATCYGPGNTQRWGVFVDFSCMHQKPRTAHEDALFQEALTSLDTLYSHPNTIVLRFTKLPEGYPSGYNIPSNANIAEYANRGWPFTESWWSSIIKDRWGSWDAGKLSGSEKTLEHMRRSCTLGVRQVALTPDQFDAEVRKKKFTNGKEDQPLCSRLYRSAFKKRLSSARVLNLNAMGMDDEQAIQLAAVLRTGVCANVKVISMHSNRVTSRGLVAVVAAITAVTFASLKKFIVGNNDFGDVGANEIAAMITEGATKSLEVLDVRSSSISSAGMQALVNAVESKRAPCLRTITAKKNAADESPLLKALKAQADTLQAQAAM